MIHHLKSFQFPWKRCLVQILAKGWRAMKFQTFYWISYLLTGFITNKYQSTIRLIFSVFFCSYWKIFYFIAERDYWIDLSLCKSTPNFVIERYVDRHVSHGYILALIEKFRLVGCQKERNLENSMRNEAVQIAVLGQQNLMKNALPAWFQPLLLSITIWNENIPGINVNNCYTIVWKWTADI